jgi:16S rRNA (guanine527-N7)-methyltransferase
MKPEWKFTLSESITKKANVLMDLRKELGLENQINVINNRVEVIHELPKHKNTYDFVTARALAKLNILITYALPLLKPKGFLLAYKAKEIDCEIKDVKDVYDQIKKSQKIIRKNDLELKIFTKEVNGVERKLVAVEVE